MKFQVQMKDPDTLQDAIEDAVKSDLSKIDQLSPEERDVLIDARRDKIGDICSKWFRYGEYLTVEIDTDAVTCVVVENRK